MNDVTDNWVRLFVFDLVDRIKRTQMQDELIDELTRGIIEGIDEAVKIVREDDERKMRARLKAYGLSTTQIDALFD